MSVLRYVGVYDADGGLAGELRYVVGHLLGRTECALCDVTHSPVRRRPAWDRFVATLGVPFELRHRNELDAALATALVTGPQATVLPTVVAELTDGRIVEVLDRAALTACDGSVERFAALLAERAPSGDG